MSSNGCDTPVLLPGVQIQTETNEKICPRWNVILHNDPDHTFQYVIEILMVVFRKDKDEAKKNTYDIHETGCSIVTTCSKERAEMYVEQVTSYGKDRYTTKNVNYPIKATMEAAE
jgi:ATP-dependent Clp protease adaptor protein ClpS